MDYTDINAEAISRWAENGWRWGRPLTHAGYLAALSGPPELLLTPTRPVPHEWFPELRGCRVLGLASGGGQQMPVLAGRGAECTLLDYSRRQLESDLEVARREGLEINAVHADMTKPLPFEDGSFDLIVNPVSVCYIRDVLPLWRECFRVLRRGGTMMAGLDNGINYIFDDSETRLAYSLPFDPLVYPGHMACLSRGDFGVQFSHTLDDQIRGQIKAGFVLRDLFEDYNESGPLSEHRVPAFWATLAEKP